MILYSAIRDYLLVTGQVHIDTAPQRHLFYEKQSGLFYEGVDITLSVITNYPTIAYWSTVGNIFYKNSNLTSYHSKKRK